MRRAAHGFSLIEILVAIAIVAILATLAVPALFFNVIRDQVVDSAPLIDLAKKKVAAAYEAGGVLPADNAAAALPAPDKMVGNYVKSLTIQGGVINVMFGNNAHKEIVGKVLSIRPAIVDDTPLVPVAWVCAFASGPAGMTVKGLDQTDIPQGALPINCRKTPVK